MSRFRGTNPGETRAGGVPGHAGGANAGPGERAGSTRCHPVPHPGAPPRACSGRRTGWRAGALIGLGRAGGPEIASVRCGHMSDISVMWVDGGAAGWPVSTGVCAWAVLWDCAQRGTNGHRVAYDRCRGNVFGGTARSAGLGRRRLARRCRQVRRRLPGRSGGRGGWCWRVGRRPGRGLSASRIRRRPWPGFRAERGGLAR